MQLVVISGLSGSGKSVALNVLEDASFYCVDNLPATLLSDTVDLLANAGYTRIAVTVDARSGAALAELPASVRALKARGVDVRLLFLSAKNDTLIKRFSETRRPHPLAHGKATLEEAITRERELLAEAAELGHRIDTSDVAPNALRAWIKDLVTVDSPGMTLLFESFGYKQGIPLDADLVFRCPLSAESVLRSEASPALRPRCRGGPLPRRPARSSTDARRHRGFPGALATRVHARQPRFPFGRVRLYRRSAPFRVFRRAARTAVSGDRARAYPSSPTDSSPMSVGVIAACHSPGKSCQRHPRPHRGIGNGLRLAAPRMPARRGCARRSDLFASSADRRQARARSRSSRATTGGTSVLRGTLPSPASAHSRCTGARTGTPRSHRVLTRPTRW